MKPLYSQEEYDTAKSMVKLPLECYFCCKTFFIEKKFITSTIKLGRGKGKYCGKECLSKSLIKAISTTCANCNKQIQKQLNQHKKSKSDRHFCSSSCAATYNNTHKTKGYRRSKLENWLEQQLKIIYTTLDIKYNSKNIISSELDICIPEFKLAFELNGIFHYQPVFGAQKLLAIQNNDLIKKNACEAAGINLFTIDISKQLRFTPASSIEYLNYICFIIYCHMF